MKKTYMNPSMEVVEIKAQQLLAGSINLSTLWEVTTMVVESRVAN